MTEVVSGHVQWRKHLHVSQETVLKSKSYSIYEHRDGVDTRNKAEEDEAERDD